MMAAFAKPVDRLPLIKAEDSAEFIKRFNEHVVTDEFKEICKKAGELFEKNKA